MSLRNVLIDDFSGGIRGEHGTKRGSTECADMVNCWPQGRNLRPMKSDDRMANTNAADSTDTLTAWKNHELYIDADGNEYIVAKRNKTMWVGFKSTTNWGSNSIIDWRPLHGDIWSGSSLLLTARGTAGARESFQQVGSTLYMASEEPTDTDYLLRWDGFNYKTGTLKYDGVTSTGKGIYASNDIALDFAAAGVHVGDILYLKNHLTGKWNVGTDATTHGFVIDGIGQTGGVEPTAPTGPPTEPSEPSVPAEPTEPTEPTPPTPPVSGTAYLFSFYTGSTFRHTLSSVTAGDIVAQPSGTNGVSDWMQPSTGNVSSIAILDSTTAIISDQFVVNGLHGTEYLAAEGHEAITVFTGYNISVTQDAQDYYDALVIYNAAVVQYQADLAQYAIDLTAYNVAVATHDQWVIDYAQYVIDLAAYNAAYAQYVIDLAAYNANPYNGIGKLIVNTSSASHCFNTTGKGPGATDYVDYIIVRVQRAGNPTGTCVATLDASALTGTFAYGVKSYRFRYANTQTGYYGTISVPSTDVTTDAATPSVRVAGWTAALNEPIDRLQIFRAEGTGPYYLVKEYDRTNTYGWNQFEPWETYYIDTGWPILATSGVGIQLETDAALYDRPPVLRNIQLFNGRLYAFGYDEDAHYLKFSTLYNYEAWPTTNWEYDTTGAGLTVEGGQVPIGANRREPLIAMVPEGGSFTTTGVSGSNLLIFSGSSAYRWYGVSWSDFNLVSAFQVGCVAPHSVVNANGSILFLNQNHVMALGSGSNDPQPCSLNLWPCGIQTDFDASSALSVLESWTACFWNQCYFLSGTIEGTYNDHIWILHIPSGVWFTNDSCVNDMRVWDNPGSDDTLIISASESILNSGSPCLLALFGGASTSAITYDSGSIRPIADPKEMYSNVKVKSITCGWHGASDSVTVQLTLYDNFKEESLDSTALAIPVKPQDGKGFFVTRWQPRVSTLEPSLLIEADAYPGLRLEWIRIECELGADGAGVR